MAEEKRRFSGSSYAAEGKAFPEVGDTIGCLIGDRFHVETGREYVVAGLRDDERGLYVRLEGFDQEIDWGPWRFYLIKRKGRTSGDIQR